VWDIVPIGRGVACDALAWEGALLIEGHSLGLEFLLKGFFLVA
jgi:hypothetical protein